MKGLFILGGGCLVAYPFLKLTWLRLKRSALKNSREVKTYTKNLRKINENEYSIKNKGVIEYSREKAIELGLRAKDDDKKTFIRPSELKRKGFDMFSQHQLEMNKIKDKKHAEAISKRIPLESLNKEDHIEDKTLRVFVDSMIDNVATLRDETILSKVDLGGFYDIVGNFVLINIDKNKEVIKVNYILLDN